MRYAAVVTKEGKYLLAHFPDAPGCQTQADPGESIEDQARDALEGWLESMLANGDVPKRPAQRAPKGRAIWVDVNVNLALKLSLRWARAEAGLTQGELAKRAGVSQQQIAKIEHPDSNPTIDTLEKVAKALGAKLTVLLESGAASR